MPIYIAASGPAAARLSGRIADGFICTSGKGAELYVDTLLPAVAEGAFDAGLVIHEARFTYHRYGLRTVVDLGEWWEAETGLPIPLGAIVARRDTVEPDRAAEWIRASVRAAWADPAASREYVLAHAAEMEPDVVDRHIALYVNEYTLDLGSSGRAAIDELLRRAAAVGAAPA